MNVCTWGDISSQEGKTNILDLNSAEPSNNYSNNNEDKTSNTQIQMKFIYI